MFFSLGANLARDEASLSDAMLQPVLCWLSHFFKAWPLSWYMMLLAWSIDVSSHIIDAMLQALLQHFSKENPCHTKNATGMVHWCRIARGVLYGHQPHRMPYMASQPVVGLPHDDIPTNWIGCWMLLRQNLPKQQLCRKHERAQRMSFFVKQVHRCLASCDSSTCVVILKPTSATRHQRHVQSWAVCRFVFSC